LLIFLMTVIMISNMDESMSVRKTSVEIDEQLVARVQEALGTSTLKETIHAALLEVVREEARRAEVEALAEMRGMDLADAAVMAGAWGT
jgi:Arc/MetJ family transcription regulator